MDDDRISLGDVPSIADESWLHQPNGSQPNQSWRPINLADDRYSIPPQPPELLGLIYAAKRHVISGPPESAKTLIAYILILEAIRDDKPVAVIDFEMGPENARRLLVELGATLDELSQIHYVAPHEPPGQNLDRIIDHGTWLVLIDAAIGAYDASGLDDNARKDVQQFARMWIDPLWKQGVATLLVDHVTKDKETRGKFTIGSERKLGAADIHLSLEAVQTISRGTHGIIKVHVHKDRAGYLRRPIHTVFDLASHPETNHISWAQRDAAPTDEEGHFRPTIYMERVSVWLERQEGEAVSRNTVEKEVTGRAQYIRQAIDALIREQFVNQQDGPNNTHLLTLQRPFTQQESGSSPVRPSASGRTGDSVRPFVPPLTGDDTPHKGENEVSSSGRTDDEETRYLLDTYVKPNPLLDDHPL